MDRASGPIARPPTVGDEVHRHLRHQLLLGAWPPGTRLREADLAASYGVSRTPVREAVRRLLQEGLLEARATQGVRVRQPDLRAALDAYEVREHLEGMAARQAAERAEGADRAALSALLDRVEAAGTADVAAQVEADLSFHRRVAELSANEPLILALDGLSGHVTPLKVHTRDQNAAARTREQHRAVADAIAAGDGARAEAAMRTHVATFAALLADRFGAGGREPAPNAAARREAPQTASR
ncbi:MAG: GntR family transcriptional regulator [Trueperaceae bacterium]|nr:GntR family transcriptional regulator [Trueperaceae bacterium]